MKKIILFIIYCSPFMIFAQTTHVLTQDAVEMRQSYKEVCDAYKNQSRHTKMLLQDYLKKYPDNPYKNRINALIGATYFLNKQYDEALAMLGSSDLSLLKDDERDQMTYYMAISHMKVGNQRQASVWFEMLKDTDSIYAADCTYYLAYIHYLQGKYEESLSEFRIAKKSKKYSELSDFYIADIYLINKEYNLAISIASKSLNRTANHPKSEELNRIIGECYYYLGDAQKAIPFLEAYVAKSETPQRKTLYLMGLTYYDNQSYSRAIASLGKTIDKKDALSQNAFFHMGLSYLRLSDKVNARMSFEQAAASNANLQVKEQAAYNYALCIHETSFSAFGSSVKVFENFLNTYPNSKYISKISGYLVELYMTTRSYDAALASIERIQYPSNRIMEAKQKILFHIGTQKFTNAKYEEAITVLGKAVALGRYNKQIKAESYYWQGESFYRLNDMRNASMNFRNYISFAQDKASEMYSLSFYNLGYTAFQRKDYSQALYRFKQYINRPQLGGSLTLADAYNRMGDCYFHTRMFNEAHQYYLLALRTNLKVGDYSYYQLALVSGLQKNYVDKISMLNKLIGQYKESPYLANAIYEKGRSYVFMENNAQAIAAFSDLTNNYPQHPLARKSATEIGLLYYQDQRYNEAIAAYKKVVENYPGSQEAKTALKDLKSIYIDINKVGEFAKLVDKLPGNIQFEASEQDSLTYIAAERIFMKGKVAQAKNSFSNYLVSFPKGAYQLNAHYYLCQIAKEQKNSNELLRHTAELQKYPNNPYFEEALVLRTEELFKLNRYNEALTDYLQLSEIASTPSRKQLGLVGALRCGFLTRDDAVTIKTAKELLKNTKLTIELSNEARYYLAKALLRNNENKSAFAQLKVLAKDTRTLYGAEAKYLVANQLYQDKNYKGAEKVILDYIEQSTPHAYWLARSFVLLSDVYVAMDRKLDAQQYLLSLQQNYEASDDISVMIKTRLEKLKNNVK